MVCKTLDYTENLLIVTSTITRCVSISAFDSFVFIPVGIGSSTAVIKIFTITAVTKRFKSMIKKK